MESLYLLIPLSILAVAGAVLVFFWMNKTGQFDDDQGPAWSILLDDDRPVQRPDKTLSDTEAAVVESSTEKSGEAAAGSQDTVSRKHET